MLNCRGGRLAKEGEGGGSNKQGWVFRKNILKWGGGGGGGVIIK